MAYFHPLLILCLSLATQSFAHTPPPAVPCPVSLPEACKYTSHVDRCVQSLTGKPESQGADLHGVVAMSFKVAVEVGTGVAADISKTLNTGVKDKALWQCLSACSSGFENAIKKLDVSMAGMDRKAMADTMGWMMTVVADTEKCCGGCKHFEGEVKEQLMGMMGKFGKQCSITLDLAKAFP
ncbi:putative invertase inhibitor [Typha latifolia]|uniref:putative invertase inhibitor n=1 Tax=Typha latifolia TaxID=4733 RepID=UPI003C30CA1B